MMAYKSKIKFYHILIGFILAALCFAPYAETAFQQVVGLKVYDDTSGIWVFAPGNSYHAYVRSIDFAHSKIHSGKRFVVTKALTLGAGASNLFLVNGTSNTDEVHFQVGVRGSGEAFYELYEDATVTSEGASLDVVNRKRLSSAVSTAQIFNAPTATDLGTLLYVEHFGSHKASGASFSDEFILKRDTYYIVNVASEASSNDITVIMDHYLN